LQFSAVVQISTVNCADMASDRPGQPANRNCYICCRSSHDLCL